LRLSLELLYDGKDSRADFDVVVRQCKVGVHFSVVGMGEFSAGFRTVIVNRAKENKFYKNYKKNSYKSK